MNYAEAIRILRSRREAAVLAMLILIFIGLSFYSEFFLTSRNLSNVARQISVVGIVSLGEALVIIAGGIDLSVGSIIGLSAVLTALAATDPGSPLLGLLTALVTGTVVGAINGLLVTKARINPFITTLGTLSVARGAALLATNGSPVRFDNWAAWLGYGKIGEVPQVLHCNRLAAAARAICQRSSAMSHCTRAGACVADPAIIHAAVPVTRRLS